MAETSTKNINNSFTVSRRHLALARSSVAVTEPFLSQVITPFRKLMLCAESRKEMEDWIGALRSVQKWETYEVSLLFTRSDANRAEPLTSAARRIPG